MQANTTTTGLMNVVGTEPCDCDAGGRMSGRTRYQCQACAGTGRRPIYEPATGITVSFDPPDVTP